MSRQFVWTLACCLVARVAAIKLRIIPEYEHTNSRTTESVTFTCTADVALAGCQFRLLDHDTKKDSLLELSQGSQSQADSTRLYSNLRGYSYSGRGLGAGDCGVTLQVQYYLTWIVACRVRAQTGGWTYAWADLVVADRALLPHSLIPREVVVLPGGEARYSLNAHEWIMACLVYSPSGLRLNFNDGAQSDDSTGRHHYFGAGVRQGECGLALSNVTEADNGMVENQIYNLEYSKMATRFMALIVARKPGHPDLTVDYIDGGVTATCVVHGGRPVANISWVLGDEVLRQDSHDDTRGNPQDEWRWPWMQGSILQKITLERQTSDNGKILKCVVTHVTLGRPLQAEETILFPELALNLTITPDRARISILPQAVTFNWTAESPLAGCQFTWWDIYTKQGPVLDLSRGAQTETNTSYLNEELTSYNYMGWGLEGGDCGISLQISGMKFWTVASRLRVANGGWSYAWASLNANTKKLLPHTVDPREAVVLLGGVARIMLKAQEPLYRCHVITFDYDLDFGKGAASNHSTGRHLYHGAGLQAGECGLALSNVSEADNGVVGFYIESKSRTKDHLSHIPLIVARRPGHPTLTVDYSNAGVTATCVVHGGRPVARISWVLDNEVLRQDSRDDNWGNAQDEWRWPWMQGSILQKITLERQANDGKVLKCVVSHVTLVRPRETMVLILSDGL